MMASVRRLKQELARSKKGTTRNRKSSTDHNGALEFDTHGYAIAKLTPQQKRNNVTELQQNWKGKAGLSSRESDIQYKYHVARLSGLYRGHAQVDNKPPRSVTNPPFWSTTGDDLRPIPKATEQLERERHWDQRFAVPEKWGYKGTTPTSLPEGKARPKSAAASTARTRHHIHKQAASVASSRRRPTSAHHRLSSGDSGHPNHPHYEARSSSISGLAGQQQPQAEPEGGAAAPAPAAAAAAAAGMGEGEEGEGGGLTAAEAALLEGRYRFTPGQAEVYHRFTNMLAEFDVSLMMSILEDALRDAQRNSLLGDYDGTELP